MSIQVFAIVALMAVSMTAQNNPLCASVSTEDATAIIGTSASRTHDPSGCAWDDATHKKVLNVAYVKSPSMFEGARAGTAAKGKNEDEKGLGGPAFSTVPTSHKGERVALYCLKGNSVLILDLDEPGATGHLPQMRDLMRRQIIEHERRCEDQPPGERQHAGAGA